MCSRQACADPGEVLRRSRRNLCVRHLALVALALVVVLALGAGPATSSCLRSRCDTKPPSTPTGLKVTSRTDSSISLAWNASTDNVGVKGYEVFRGSTKVGTTTTTSHTVTSLRCGTSYKLAVQAFDAAGNRSKKAALTSSTKACPPPEPLPPDDPLPPPEEPAPPTTGAALPGTLLPSLGSTYYVATWGSDENPGSLDTPWRTVQRALDSLNPGEKVLVRGGTYRETMLMSRSGSAEAPITVAAYPGEHVVLRPDALSGGAYVIQLYSAAYVRLNGFVLDGSTGTSAANVYVARSSHHVEISGNEIRYGQDQGVFVERTTSHVHLLGNRVHDNGWNHLPGQHQSHGLYIQGSHHLIANNLVHDHPHGFGIHLYPANHDTLVVGNTVAASGRSSIVLGGSEGVYNIVIRNNILHGGNWGVEMDSSCPTGSVVTDSNLIYAYKVAPIESGCVAADTGGGNILSSPQFVDYGNRDLRLEQTSPAVDVALPDWSAANDIEGRHRPQGSGPDIGAFER